MTDQDFLAKAIEIGNQIPEPFNFGAVIVKDGQIISTEHNHVHETNNPSLHAEVCAISAACKVADSNHLDGAVLYASHQPCTMCFACAAWAHIDRIVYATAASEQDTQMYEFKNPNIEALAKELSRPMIVEHVPLNQ